MRPAAVCVVGGCDDTATFKDCRGFHREYDQPSARERICTQGEASHRDVKLCRRRTVILKGHMRTVETAEQDTDEHSAPTQVREGMV